MKSYKKFIATVATATLVASAIVPVASASFTDVEETHEFASYIDAAVKAGYVKGYADGTFGVNDHLKRSQVVIIIGRYLEKLGYTSTATTSPWSDVTDEEVIKYGNIVKDAGVFTGYADSTLNGTGFITRENMAVVLDRLAKTVTGTSLSEVAKDIEDVKVADLAMANAAYQESIQALRDLEISTADNFNPKGNLKRGQFAKFIVTAVEKIDAIEVAPEVTAEDIAKEIADVDATLPVVADITADNAVAAKQLTVESVTAINANELETKFNKEVLETSANYVFTAKSPSSQGEITATDIELKDDNKTVVVQFAADTLVPTTTYTVKVGEILATDYSKLVDFEGEITIVEDKTAPTLKAIKLEGTDLKVTFSEPVSLTAETVLRVDGVQIPVTGATNPTEAGDYEYTIDASAYEVATKVGAHNVTIVGLKDVKGNEASTITSSYVVTNDTVAPTVQSVKATGQDTFVIEFSEAVTNPVVKVTKGSTEFTAVVTDPTVAAKKHTVTINQTAGSNNLYGTKESTATVNVEVKDFQDAVKLIGTTYYLLLLITTTYYYYYFNFIKRFYWSSIINFCR